MIELCKKRDRDSTMKRILVTGGAGFIGNHLCRRLLNEGNYVICLDNFFTGLKRHIEDMLGNPNFELIEHDIVEPVDIEVDQIYNLACPASPPHYQYDPVKTMKTSVLGIINMLELAKKYKATLLHASTSEVYGNPLVHPQQESYWGNVNPIGIRSCYDEGKRAAETLMMDYHRQYGVDIRIIRIFNTYGPNMDPKDGRVVSNCIFQAINGDDITIYGDGSQTRSFCYVSDLVDGAIKMMNNDKSFIGPVNLGNPSERTVLNLAEIVLEMTGSRSKITYKDLPSDDPVKRKPDITKAQEILGWKPEVDIKDGLAKTIEYFKSIQ